MQIDRQREAGISPSRGLYPLARAFCERGSHAWNGSSAPPFARRSRETPATPKASRICRMSWPCQTTIRFQRSLLLAASALKRVCSANTHRIRKAILSKVFYPFSGRSSGVFAEGFRGVSVSIAGSVCSVFPQRFSSIAAGASNSNRTEFIQRLQRSSSLVVTYFLHRVLEEGRAGFRPMWPFIPFKGALQKEPRVFLGFPRATAAGAAAASEHHRHRADEPQAPLTNRWMAASHNNQLYTVAPK